MSPYTNNWLKNGGDETGFPYRIPINVEGNRKSPLAKHHSNNCHRQDPLKLVGECGEKQFA